MARNRFPFVTFAGGAVLLFSHLSFGATTPPTLSLRSAINIALERNPVIGAAKSRFEESDSLLGQVRASAFPTLSAALNATHKKDAVSFGSPSFGGEAYNTYNAQLNLVQPLYVGGAFWAGYSVAQQEKAIRRLDFEIARRDLSVSVIQAFYLLLLNQEKLETLKRTAAVEKESLQTAEKRYRIGRGQLLDVLQIKTQISLLQSRIAQATSDLETSTVALVNLLGDRETKSITIKGTLRAHGIRPLVDEAKKEHYRIPEFERIAAKQDQFENQTTVNLAKHYPQLNLVGNVSRNAHVKQELTNSYSQSWSMALQLSIPLFSGLSSVSERHSLAAQSEQLRMEETRLKNQTALDEVRAAKDLEAAEAVIEAASEALGYARNSVKEAQRGYRLATIDYLQFLTVQTSLLDAELGHSQALFNYVNSSAKYLVASGHSLEGLIQVLEASNN